jgi:hypothetical protein
MFSEETLTKYMHVSMYLCMYVNVYVNVYVNMYVVRVCVCVCAYIYIYIYIVVYLSTPSNLISLFAGSLHWSGKFLAASFTSCISIPMAASIAA